MCWLSVRLVQAAGSQRRSTSSWGQTVCTILQRQHFSQSAVLTSLPKPKGWCALLSLKRKERSGVAPPFDALHRRRRGDSDRPSAKSFEHPPTDSVGRRFVGVMIDIRVYDIYVDIIRYAY